MIAAAHRHLLATSRKLESCLSTCVVFGFAGYILWLCFISSVCGHIPDSAVTPSNKIEQFCSLAETCIHDTVPVCGKMGEDKRTFLDLCDMLEFVCDTNQIFVHVDDMEGCPIARRTP